MSQHNDPAFSVVIPIYNEEDNIEPLYSELSTALDPLRQPYEVIAVDDGSRDQTFARLKAVHERDPRWHVIRFRRNFGQTAGLSAGFHHARAPIIVTIDADLQNDPCDIPRVLAKLDEGYDIVSGWRMNRKEPFFSRRLPSMLANGLISRTTGVNLHDYGCTLKAYRSEVTRHMQLYGEMHRFIPALSSAIGVEVAEIPVSDRARRFGKSKYGIGRTLRVILDLITVSFFLNYSNRPLHIFGIVGVGVGLLGFVIGLYLTYIKVFLGQPIGDRPLLLLAVVLVILGVQVVSMGLVAEMITRTYHEAQNKPTYIVREILDDSHD